MKKFFAFALAALLAVPAWGASFKRINPQKFLDLCETGPAEQIASAIEAGVDANVRDGQGETALMKAAKRNGIDAMRVLIAADANINARDSDGDTALMFAAGKNTVEVVNALIAAGADVNARNGNGESALMKAAAGNTPAVIDALIEAGAGDDADENGQTSLMKAAAGNTPEALDALLEAGAYVRARDKDGRRAIDYARRNKKLKDTGALARLEFESR